MRGVIDIINSAETCVPLEDGPLGVIAPEWLRGFEREYLDQRQYLAARRRYWMALLKEQDPAAVTSGEDNSVETHFVVSAARSDGMFAVLEDDGETGYLYVYDARREAVTRSLHVYDRSADIPIRDDDVWVGWSLDGTKCGVRIWNKMRGIIDMASGQEGRVWLTSRSTPGIADSEWLRGFGNE